VSLRDDSGAEVSKGRVGELFSRSPYLFNGYWKVPSVDTPGLDGEWFSSGDLAQRDEDGYLYIVGRKDDSIITGGINVYPREIEEAMSAHGDVAEVVVYGVPDERWGEAVYASVRLRQTGTVSAEELISFAKQKLSAYKTPKFVEIVDDLPRNASGKVLRRVLRAKFAALDEQPHV
jgi:acyl-CoA synthetase (AMP-forming)/AMP-acid ligase II